MARPLEAHSWWDREADSAGRVIRQDVRTAAHQLWEQACRRTDAVLADRAQAADLMERSVAEISRYLDRVGAPLSRPKHGLVMLAFCRALRRHAGKVRRLELVGGSLELSQRNIDEGWLRRLDTRLELENVARRLSKRNRDVFLLRAAGYAWPEIAQCLRTSVTTARNGFWREIGRIRRTNP
jgi:DNA-directed RNA polymerase specialized sigma24 family protein